MSKFGKYDTLELLRGLLRRGNLSETFVVALKKEISTREKARRWARHWAHAAADSAPSGEDD
jgi:hypothetical protein